MAGLSSLNRAAKRLGAARFDPSRKMGKRAQALSFVLVLRGSAPRSRKASKHCTPPPHCELCRQQLEALREARGAGRDGKKSGLAGRKVAPKYRGPGGELWAGRGAQPLWFRDALKAGKKAEDFLIAKGTKNSTAQKVGRPQKKRWVL
jgi:DNA-binding protein H-NS